MVSNSYAKNPEFSKSSGLLGRALWNIFTGLIVFLSVDTVWARPEYALRLGNNRCTNCHFSPAGGGPLNLNGKYYGANGFRLSPFSAQEYAGGEARFNYYAGDKHTQTRGGLGAMVGSVWASIPVSENQSGSAEFRLVGEHNISGYSASGPRNLYLLRHIKDQTRKSWLPQDILFGRFIPPYGVMTDEHRTYVRLQTASAWHTGLRMGAMASSNPYEWFHYDLAIVNGQENNGTSPATAQATQWGGLANLRFTPAGLGVMFGLSGAFYEASENDTSRSSRSAYTGLSFHRLTKERFKATLLVEYAEAVNWNTTSFANYFVSDTAYATSLNGAESAGWLAQLNWEVSRLVTLQYKYDRVELDRNFPGDLYQRHGFGFKHMFGPNMWFMMRYENAMSSRPGEEEGTKMGALDAFWTVIKVGI